MNKIFNWTVGSFFRSIGRILAYLVIGSLIGYLLYQSDFKLTNLLFMTVKADTTQNFTSATYEVQQCYQRPLSDHTELYNCTSDSANYNHAIQFGSSNGHLKRIQYLLYNSSDYWNAGQYTIQLEVSRSTSPNNDKYLSELTGRYGFRFYANENATSNGAIAGYNSKYVNTYSCNVTDDSTSTQDFYVNCTFSTKQSLKFLMIEMYLTDTQTAISNTDWIMWFRVNQFLGITDPTSAINNQTEIINNSINNSTNQIIDNQNQNTQQQIESQKVCKVNYINENYNFVFEGYLDGNGNIQSYSGAGLTDYLELDTNSYIKFTKSYPSPLDSCFFTSSKTLISCVDPRYLTVGSNITIPSNAKYVRFSVNKSSNSPNYELYTCANGNQALSDDLNNLNNNINDDDVESSTNEASDFFEDFTTDTHGLTGIITAPLNAINSLTSATCSPLVLPLPFVNQDLTLPCMRTIYETNFGAFMTLYDVITLGIISYWVSIRIFNLVKDFKNPEHDEIEVMDL